MSLEVDALPPGMFLSLDPSLHTDGRVKVPASAPASSHRFEDSEALIDGSSPTHFAVSNDFMLGDFDLSEAVAEVAGAAVVPITDAAGGGGEGLWGGSFEGEEEDFGFGVPSSLPVGGGLTARGGIQGGTKQGGGGGAAGVLDLLTVDNAGKCTTMMMFDMRSLAQALQQHVVAWPPLQNCML